MTLKISFDFFKGSTIDIAKRLLGSELVITTNEKEVGGIITETEAYTEDDPASHAYKGKQTKRNKTMFLSAGHIYIYFIYGMYHCFNIVTEEEGVGSAVLIREMTPSRGIDQIQKNRPHIKNPKDLLNGPAKLMLGLNIPTSLNGKHIIDNPNIRLEYKAPAKNIQSYPRIGITKGTDRLWRFRATLSD